MNTTNRIGDECWFHEIKLREGTQGWKRGRLLAWSTDTATIDWDANGHPYKPEGLEGLHPVGLVEDLTTGTVHSLPVGLIRFCDQQPKVDS